MDFSPGELKDFCEKIANQLVEKHNRFLQNNFEDVYELCQHVANHEDIVLSTQGFTYHEDSLPTNWVKQGKDVALERYFNTMNELQELYGYLQHFTEEVSSDFFEESCLFCKVNERIIRFNLLIGQGSDFTILVEKEKEPKFIFESFQELVSVAKIPEYQQALFYAKNIKDPEKLLETIFQLGSARYFTLVKIN